MSYILCIETATEICSVALSENNKLLAFADSQTPNSHASQLHVLVENVLTKSGIKLRQLDAIAVSKGPGSYTGLRLGISAAKGYCYALNIPLISINTLQSLAQQVVLKSELDKSNSKILLCPMLDARRMEVYCGLYDFSLNEIEATQAIVVNENFQNSKFTDFKVLLFGNGSEKCKLIIQNPNAIFIDEIKCNAKSMIELAANKFQKKEFEDVAYFEPFYLKDFVGTVSKK